MFADDEGRKRISWRVPGLEMGGFREACHATQGVPCFGSPKESFRNREDAEDAVQTALLETLRHLDTFQGRSRFSSWLTRITLNAAFMRLRSSRRQIETSLDEIVERSASARFEVVKRRSNPEQECSAKEARATLIKAIDRLGPLHCEVIHMFHVQELPAKEAARVLGVPVGTVKARLHRACTRPTRNVQSILARGRRPTVRQIRTQTGLGSSKVGR